MADIPDELWVDDKVKDAWEWATALPEDEACWLTVSWAGDALEGYPAHPIEDCPDTWRLN